MRERLGLPLDREAAAAVPEGARLRHRHDRQVASRPRSGLPPARPRVRRVLRVAPQRHGLSRSARAAGRPLHRRRARTTGTAPRSAQPRVARPRAGGRARVPDRRVRARGGRLHRAASRPSPSSSTSRITRRTRRSRRPIATTTASPRSKTRARASTPPWCRPSTTASAGSKRRYAATGCARTRWSSSPATTAARPTPRRARTVRFSAASCRRSRAATAFRSSRRGRERSPPGRVVDAAISTLDLLPTALELAGAERPTDRTLDGSSLLALLRGKGKAPNRDAFVWNLGRHWAVRRGDWKLVQLHGQQAAAVRPLGGPRRRPRPGRATGPRS